MKYYENNFTTLYSGDHIKLKDMTLEQLKELRAIINDLINLKIYEECADEINNR